MSTPDRPYTVALSADEVIALVRYHTSCARKVPKAMGKAMLNLTDGKLFPQQRALKALSEEAKRILEAHTTRARGLMSFLPK